MKKGKIWRFVVAFTFAFYMIASMDKTAYATTSCINYYYTGQHKYTRMTYTHRKYYENKITVSSDDRYCYIPYDDVLMGVCECGAETELGIIRSGTEKRDWICN